MCSVWCFGRVWCARWSVGVCKVCGGVRDVRVVRGVRIVPGVRALRSVRQRVGREGARLADTGGGAVCEM